MWLALWDDDKLVAANSVTLTVHLIPPAAFHAVDENILCHTFGPLTIVVHRMGVIADVGDVELTEIFVSLAGMSDHVW